MSDTSQDTKTPHPYRLSIRRPVTVAMLFLTLIVFGWKSYQQLPLNLMPDISYPTLSVRTEYEGAAPEDVEKLVTRPLEERLSIVSGLVEISSISSAGLSEIILEFTWDSDMNLAMQDVRESLDQFYAPQGVTKKPIILRFDPSLDPVMRIAISGSDAGGAGDPFAQARLASELMEIREAAERQIKSDLEAEVGIAQIVIKGGREEEIQILVDSERLKNLGLSLGDVSNSLQVQNINLSGGRLRDGRTEYLVRTLNEFQDIEDIRGVVIQTREGHQYRLEDVALVGFGEKERKTIVRVNGQEVVAMDIFKEGGANTVKVCNKLKDFFGFEREAGVGERAMLFLLEHSPFERSAEVLKENERLKKLANYLRSRLPKYAKPILITDQSRFIVASIREVQRTAIAGGILALLVLFLFLRELRSTVIIGVAIPISVVATFIPMFLRDVSLNIMSLGGLALGVGMLVDNSIVVLESIFRCSEEGDGALEAAERGTNEVSSAVTASTLTTIAVFFPIVFVQGIAGQLFEDLALTVTFSLIASLLVALYLIPMVASRKKLSFRSGEQVVWLLRGYAELRGDGGRGMLGALAGIPARGAGYVGQWFGEMWGETVGLTAGSVASTVVVDGGKRRNAPLKRVAATIVLPMVFLLFCVQLVLKTVTTVGVTILFLVSLLVLGLLWVAGKLLGLILSMPVNLFGHGFNALRGIYLIVLRQALRFSPLVLAGVAALAVHAGYTALSLGRELIPPLKQGEFGIRLEAPPGTRLASTERRAQQIEAIVRSNPYVDSVTVEVGSDEGGAGSDVGENVATLTVKLRNPEETVRIQDEIIEAMRHEVKAATPDEITFTLPTLFSFKTAVEVQIYGDNLELLRTVGLNALAAIRDVAGLKDGELSLKEGYPEVHIVMDRPLLAAKGLSPNQVAQALRMEVQGDVATRFSRGGDKIDIRVRSNQDRLSSLDDLRNLSVVDGFPPTPLSSVASIAKKEGPSEIRRIDQRQVVVVTANVEGRDLGSVSRDIEARLAALDWPKGYDYLLGGQNRELETSYSGLVFALLLAVFLVYVVMACQFESLWHPALIMFSVPLAFIGVVYVLDWWAVNLSVVVFIGGIVLAGIVVNGAIVLVDYINRLRGRGLSKLDAIVEAGKVRFRPIMMTTMTTVLGLIPMVLSSGEGAEIRRPMAMTVIAGLCSATVLTLIVIPIVYNSFGGRDRA